MSQLSPELTQEVEKALPRGNVYQMPEEWRQALAERDARKESPSSISTYLACPLKWYLERYSGATKREDSVASVIGTFVHRVLEVFYCEPANLRTEQLLEDTFLTAWDALKESNAEDGIVPPDLIASMESLVRKAPNADALRMQMYRRAKESIDAIMEFDGDPSKVQVLSTEKWLRATVDNVQIRGKVDRIVATKTGQELVQDYKSGQPTGMNAGLLDPVMVPVGMYAWMRMRETSKEMAAPVVRGVQLMYLAHMKRRGVVVTPELLDQIDLLMKRVVAQMNDIVRTGQITARPEGTPDRGPCSWCPAKASCPAWTDGDWAPLREMLEI